MISNPAIESQYRRGIKEDYRTRENTRLNLVPDRNSIQRENFSVRFRSSSRERDRSRSKDRVLWKEDLVSVKEFGERVERYEYEDLREFGGGRIKFRNQEDEKAFYGISRGRSEHRRKIS
jgi:hypothetical protein